MVKPIHTIQEHKSTKAAELARISKNTAAKLMAAAEQLQVEK